MSKEEEPPKTLPTVDELKAEEARITAALEGLQPGLSAIAAVLGHREKRGK